MSRQRKTAAVLRLLRGEDLETVSRALGVTAATLSTRGAACAQPDTADCESLMVRCCDRHCRYVAF